MLYTPTDQARKYQAKAFIDMFFLRFAKGVSALIILAVNFWLVPLGWEVRHFAILSLFFIAVWIEMVYLAGNRFAQLTQTQGQRI